MDRTMLRDTNLLDVYWKEVVHTVVYICNQMEGKVQ